MKRTTAICVALVYSLVSSVYADYTWTDQGTWPKSWPAELEPLRKQSRTFEGPKQPLLHHAIPFTKRDEFESAWPHLLKIKSKGAPIILRRGPSFWLGDKATSGVCVHTPPAGEAPIADGKDAKGNWEKTIHIELIVDGEIIDLNRIPLPADTPIIDERFAKNGPEKQSRQATSTEDRVAQRQQVANNLKQIGLAMHNYHSTHNAFPPAANVDKKGKQLLSWRVHILPFVDQIALYQKFHLDEPWDSEHNKGLIQTIPSVYISPSHADLAKDGKTVYLVPTGKSTAFEGKEGLAIREFTDGTSNTILAVEAHRDAAVIWTKPDDLAVDFKNPLKGLKGAHTGAFFAVLCNGSVRFISENIDLDTLKALFTRNGGEASLLVDDTNQWEMDWQAHDRRDGHHGRRTGLTHPPAATEK